ncbi:uncharacterized protein LOC133815261 [Humulus lupulus]|uniref:uncharacterized protein LOC133815261 n=1 Tax=Humulus lupulus TaxID=3486 RepID=UPI002B4170A3|nr:uncharacterized protein LOC133815261 [Humulus lupulus]
MIVEFKGFHSIKKDRFRNGSKVAFKLDMAKAYDKVEWVFIEEFMRKLRYNERWIRKIMRCVELVRFSFLVNGEVMGEVCPGRGLRQGDPLLPFLVLFCTEALSCLIQRLEDMGKIHGITFGRNKLCVSHMFFEDDSLIFFEANKLECLECKRILHIYSLASGKLVNFSKSEMAFGKNVPRNDRTSLASVLGVKVVENFGKYLAFPSCLGRREKEMLSAIKDKVWNRLKGWKAPLFSTASREILIKAIIQAIPTCSMSYFKFLKNLISDFHRMAARFWWGSSKKKRKIHWCKWTKLCISKEWGVWVLGTLAPSIKLCLLNRFGG